MHPLKNVELHQVLPICGCWIKCCVKYCCCCCSSIKENSKANKEKVRGYVKD